MNIVILDGKTTNPGDITWEPLEALGSVTYYDNTPAELVTERAKNADAIIMNRIVMSREVMKSLPKLRYIGALATGYNTIDTKAATELGITVTNIPFYCVETVAQLAFSLILRLCGHVTELSDTVRSGGWDDAIEMSWKTLPIFELYGKTLGIVGFGNIGRTVAALGRALGMNILVFNRTPREMPEGYRRTNIEEVFSQSDVVSIHCALTDDTRGLVDRKLLSLMKPTAFLINTSRGAVINEQHLADALNSGLIAGAGLDVMIKEPPECDNPLLSAKNCVITPHIAWASRDARQRLVKIVADNLRSYLEGNTVNSVNS